MTTFLDNNPTLQNIKDTIISLSTDKANTTDVNTALAGKFDKTGGEITGHTTLINRTVRLRDTYMDVTATSLEEDRYNLLIFRDKNDKTIGHLEFIQYMSGRSRIRMMARKAIDDINYDNGLSLYVNNDGTKTVSVDDKAAWRTALACAPLASPGFTGTPTAPTATAGTNTTQIATTAFVQTGLADKANADDVYTKTETDDLLDAKANSASPSFTGTPTFDSTGVWRNALGLKLAYTAVEPSAVSVASGTATDLASITLEAGYYIVSFTANFASNATGYRLLRLSRNSGGSHIGYAYLVTQQAVSGSTTSIGRTMVLEVQSTTTYYLVAIQNSGTALNVTGRVYVLSII